MNPRLNPGVGVQACKHLGISVSPLPRSLRFSSLYDRFDTIHYTCLACARSPAGSARIPSPSLEKSLKPLTSPAFLKLTKLHSIAVSLPETTPELPESLITHITQQAQIVRPVRRN